MYDNCKKCKIMKNQVKMITCLQCRRGLEGVGEYDKEKGVVL